MYVCACLSLTLAGRQEERRANQRARFHKSWLLIGREGQGIVNKEKSLSGSAAERVPLPRLGRAAGQRPRPPWVSAGAGTGVGAGSSPLPLPPFLFFFFCVLCLLVFIFFFFSGVCAFSKICFNFVSRKKGRFMVSGALFFQTQ